MTIKLVYSQSKGTDLLDFLSQIPDIEFVALNEDYYKDKKKAIQLKSSCGTKLIPFVAIYDNKELVKAFYSEVSECNVDNVSTYLTEHE